MPYKDRKKQLEAQRQSMAKLRQFRRGSSSLPGVAKVRPPVPLVPVKRSHRDPAGTFASWCESRLIVPPGHPNSGKPLVIPEYALAFLREALAPGVREAGLFVARKNAKSAVIAALALSHLAPDGPLRRKGWRAGFTSLSREKAVELWGQSQDIAEASGIEGVKFWRSPRAIESDYGKVDILAADSKQGHASGYDLVVCDELGLYHPVRGRALVQGLISSTSTRDGRLIAISVIGDCPLSRELIDRAGDPSTVVRVHEAPRACELEDENAWRAANPTLGTVKSLEYMRDMARRAAANPTEQAAFRAFDLNQPGSPTSDMIVGADRWAVCANRRRPERDGACCVGLDAGGSSSMTAAALYFFEVGRLECYGAFGDVPGLGDRGVGDGCGERYLRMEKQGELVTFPGRVTPVADFLAWLADLLEGERVELLIADRYRQGEVEDAMNKAGVLWPVEWRAQGTGASGSADIRAFQKAVLSGDLRPGDNLLIESAILESRLRYDGNGNPALDKARQKGRIDALSASVLAVGAGARLASMPTTETTFYRPPQQAAYR